jgi:hypothetical protein
MEAITTLALENDKTGAIARGLDRHRQRLTVTSLEFEKETCFKNMLNRC